MGSNVGEVIEKNGWRQGAVVKQEDIAFLTGDEIDCDYVIIVSQSCDVTNGSLITEPSVEGVLARKISSVNGDYTYAKNARILHAYITLRGEVGKVQGDSFVERKVPLELKAIEKITFPRARLQEIKPNSNAVLVNKELDSLVSWLAARYSRPAFPTEFNNRLANADPKKKARKAAKSLNSKLSGIYVEIEPNCDIPKGQNYRVNILGLVHASYEGDIKREVEPSLKKYAAPMIQSGMDVKVVAIREDEITFARVNSFKKCYYDDLSIKD